MANFTITVTNRLNLFAHSPTVKWGTMVWGTDVWGLGSIDEIDSVGKVVSESLAMTTDYGVGIQANQSDELTMTDDIMGLTLVDSSGYYHVFPGQVTEREDSSSTSWTGSTQASSSYSQSVASSTTWTLT